MSQYGATGNLCAPAQEMMGAVGPKALQKRKVNIADIFGIEGKNTYELYHESEKGEMIGRAGEESACLERICLQNGRGLEWSMRRYNKTGPLAFKVKKERSWVCCACFSRPAGSVSDGEGHFLGKLTMPCTPCNHPIEVSDSNSKMKWKLDGSCLQVGVCCPCVQDAVFTITDASGREVGDVRRLQLTLFECCCPQMRWAVKFPPDASPEDKILLLSAQMMLDTYYFDIQNNNDNAGGH